MALPARSQSAGVLNSPPIIITVGSCGGGTGGEPRRRQVDEFAAVLEMRRRRRNRHRHDAALGRQDVLGLGLAAIAVTRGRVGLVGQRAGGQLVPRGLHGREIADPEVERQRRAEQTQRHRQHRHAAPPPACAAPAQHQHTGGQAGQRDPPPQLVRCRVIGQTVGWRCTSACRRRRRHRRVRPPAATAAASGAIASRPPAPARRAATAWTAAATSRASTKCGVCGQRSASGVRQHRHEVHRGVTAQSCPD